MLVVIIIIVIMILLMTTTTTITIVIITTAEVAAAAAATIIIIIFSNVIIIRCFCSDVYESYVEPDYGDDSDDDVDLPQHQHQQTADTTREAAADTGSKTAPSDPAPVKSAPSRRQRSVAIDK